jgi:hypothetical protein
VLSYELRGSDHIEFNIQNDISTLNHNTGKINRHELLTKMQQNLRFGKNLQTLCNGTLRIRHINTISTASFKIRGRESIRF